MSMQKGAISAKKNSGSDDVVNSSVFKLAWPIFVQALLSMLLGYIDTLMLSGYDQTAVGAIGNANQILGFLTLAFTIISSASGVVVAQYLGAGKKDKINQIYTVCVAFNLALSLIVSGIVYVGSDGLMKLLNTPEAMMPDARSYMRIVGGFIFTQAVLDTMSRIFQSNGRTEFGMIISLGMNILNVCGNYLFLYGPLKSLGLGASGVAVSTTFSRIAGLCAAFVFFSAFIDGHISVKYLRPFPKDILKTLLRLGIPTAGENISYNISQLFVTGFVNTLGIAAINTKIYANILISFAYLYSVSVAMATTIIVGHAVGAGDYEVYLCAVFAFLRLPTRHASLYAGYAEGFFYAVDVLQAKLFKGVSRPGVVYCCAELQRPKLLVGSAVFFDEFQIKQRVEVGQLVNAVALLVVEAQVFANEVAIV